MSIHAALQLSKLYHMRHMANISRSILTRVNCFSKLIFCRNSSGNSLSSLKYTTVNTSVWQPIYRFPFIVPARIFQRSKLYMTFISTFSFPYVMLLLAQGGISLNEAVASVAISCFSLALLYFFGTVFRHLIGSVYISKTDNRQVLISHLSFFGNRRNIQVDLEDITPLTEINANMNDYFLRVCPNIESLSSLQQSLFMCIKYGGILDTTNFEKVFGSTKC